MRLLHAGPDLFRGRLLKEGHAKDDDANPRMDERQSLPLRRLSEHRRRDQTGARQNGSVAHEAFRLFAREPMRQSAINRVAANPQGKFLGGGTNLVDLMKMGVETPEQLVDINRLPLAQGGGIAGQRRIRIGALVRNSDLAEHPLITSRYPVLSEALLSGASPQLRNMATTGGNLLQRTRCYYFYDPAFPDVQQAQTRERLRRARRLQPHPRHPRPERAMYRHASKRHVRRARRARRGRARAGAEGERAIPFADFHRLPGTTPNVDTNLQPNELITAVDLPAIPFATRSHYLKVRDRASYAFALVSVAAALEMEGEKSNAARVALGGVAHKPWRAPKPSRL